MSRKKFFLANAEKPLLVIVAVFFVSVGIVAAVKDGGPSNPVFPGAVGFGVETPAGRGGRVIKVTTLAADGEGSFREAVSAKGPRIVVFEVGGVIDLGKQVVTISEPFITIAGQTAPSLGVTFIRGGIVVATHDVLVQHIRVRTGDAGLPRRSGWETDALSTEGAWNVVVDHCSLSWGTDENLSASGKRFDGKNLLEWREHTSHDITFSNSIIAEGLYKSTVDMSMGHSKGSLIHDNVTNISIIGNLYASNASRNPVFKGGVEGIIVNNFIFNPQSLAVHFNLDPTEWKGHPFALTKMALVGNVLRYGPSTLPGLNMLYRQGSGLLELYDRGNRAWDAEGKPVDVRGRFPWGSLRVLLAPPLWPEGLKALPANQVEESVLANAGARPWDRDQADQRIIRDVRLSSGKIIDSQEEVGGYPGEKESRRELSVPKDRIEEWLAGFAR